MIVSTYLEFLPLKYMNCTRNKSFLYTAAQVLVIYELKYMNHEEAVTFDHISIL